MLADTIRDYYAYARWANQKILEQAGNLTESQFLRSDLDHVWPVRDTLVHMMSGQEAWLQRWLGDPEATLVDPGQFPDIASISDHWGNVDKDTIAFLDALDDARLADDATYRNFRGDIVTTPLWKQVLHQCNHQTYHRGEVAALLSSLGYSPGEIDYSRYFLIDK